MSLETQLEQVATDINTIKSNVSAVYAAGIAAGGDTGVGEKYLANDVNAGEIFNDYENNKAIGPYTQASGYQTKAGVTGYYFTRLEIDETKSIGTFYISNTQYGTELTEEEALALPKDFTFNYIVGDTVSYVSDSKYLDIGTITNIDAVNKIVTVTATKTGTLVKGAFDTGVDDQIFYVREKPEDGIIPFGHYATAEGEGTFAAERGSHAEGRQTIARGQYGHAEGRQTIADYAAHAEGRNTQALGNSSHTEGVDTVASDTAAHAEGRNTQANGQQSHAEGKNTQANGQQSHAEGGQNIANGSSSHAEGDLNQAIGFASHAEGQSNEAIGNGSHAEGNGNKSIGTYSHAEGNATITEGLYAHSEGNGTIVKGEAAHGEGKLTKADGECAHSEGYSTKAIGNRSHAEGLFSEATGDDSHAEGSFSKAIGRKAHAEGQSCEARGKHSHAEGLFAKAFGETQHVQGKYNIIDYENKYAHIVGNGTAETETEPRKLSNAHTLDWDGNAWFAGDVVAGDISLQSLMPTVITSGESTIVYNFSDRKNKVTQEDEIISISFDFGNEVYDRLYGSELSFDSGATPTSVDYAIPEEPTQISVINWVGVDCAPDSYINDNGETVPISKFQPSANTHYDIVFYFNGKQFIGLVNGYVPAGGNEAV